MRRDDELLIQAAAHDAAEQRLASLARAGGVAVRRGTGWVAVRTEAASNDLNGVVSQLEAEITPHVVRDLIDWFGASPASWLTHRPAAGLTATLLEVGARAERSGRWSGLLTRTTVRNEPAAVEVVRVRSEDDLDRWLDVATACGWISDDQDRRARRALYTAVGWDGALTQWLALDGDDAVGFASSYSHGHVLDLCNLGVLASRRREGIGRALVAARIAAGRCPKITIVVSAPSPDGWHLQRALGFASVPVIPDRCFYLPTAPLG